MANVYNKATRSYHMNRKKGKNTIHEALLRNGCQRHRMFIEEIMYWKNSTPAGVVPFIAPYLFYKPLTPLGSFLPFRDSLSIHIQIPDKPGQARWICIKRWST